MAWQSTLIWILIITMLVVSVGIVIWFAIDSAGGPRPVFAVS